ncbi:hypothetical protein [Bacillus cereus]|uniref:hypothetical protein n=1 Tax=Bacillus cereus TaxID=1396 RepID=UPI000BFAE725|nr:hypothetical protein [Bacillus cereus]PET95937.1 hypothetical protein CN531_31425 [Bacillus cereus]
MENLYHVVKKFFRTLFLTKNGEIDFSAILVIGFLIVITWIVKQGFRSIKAIQNTTRKDQVRMMLFFSVYTIAVISMPFLDSASAGIVSIITSISVTVIITYMQGASSKGSQKQVIEDLQEHNNSIKVEYEEKLKRLENKLHRLENKLDSMEYNQKKALLKMDNANNNLIDNQEKTLKLIGQIKRVNKFNNKSLRRKARNK